MPLTNRQVLEYFIAAVEELRSSAFLKQIAEGVHTRLEVHPDGATTVGKFGPDQEALKACLLTVRMFGQDNDAISFRRVSRVVTEIPVDQQLKAQFEQSRTNFNTYLDMVPRVQIEGVNTNRLIFETFLYGKYAHHSAQHVATLEKWAQAIYYPDLLAQFDLIVLEFIKAASAMANRARVMLKAKF
jgi:hypothetical protein